MCERERLCVSVKVCVCVPTPSMHTNPGSRYAMFCGRRDRSKLALTRAYLVVFPPSAAAAAAAALLPPKLAGRSTNHLTSSLLCCEHCGVQELWHIEL